MQYITKIPPAITKEEREDDLVAGCDGRYEVVHLPTGQVVASRVAAREALEAAWLCGGRDYVLEPRMVASVAEKGDAKAQQQQAVGVFGPEWDVYFKAQEAEPWQRSGLTAYGVTQREAILALLDEAFRRAAWPAEFQLRRMENRLTGAPGKLRAELM